MLVSLAACASAPMPEPLTELPGPLQLPVRTYRPLGNYVLGPEDVLSVSVYAVEKPLEPTTLELEVAADGVIVVPLVDKVQAAGKTVPELRDALVRAYAAFIVAPSVNVSV